MEIKEIINNGNYKQRKEEILPFILDQIFLICKEDENFNITEKLNNYDKIIENSKQQLTNKQQLIDKSKIIEEKLLIELNQLDKENHSRKNNLLKELGSESDD